jgi:hypothetical protein
MSVLEHIVQATYQMYFLREQKQLDMQKAEAKREMLDEMSGGGTPSAPETTGNDTETPENGGPEDHTERINGLIENETCMTCKMALEEMRELPPEEQGAALDFFEDEFKPAKQAFADGKIPKDELESKTDELLDLAGV